MQRRMNYAHLDIKRVLEHLTIDFIETHINVSRGWVGVCCPFCDDDSYHGGINLTHGNYSCWKCHETRPFEGILPALTTLPRLTILALLERQSAIIPVDVSERLRERLGGPGDKPERTSRRTEDYPLPKHCKPVDQAPDYEPFHRFLQDRQFTLEDTTRRGCLVCTAGDYQHRLIVPVKQDGLSSGWQARDLTGWSKVKYKNPDGFKLHDYLYGIKPTGSKRVILVEGVFDQWRLDRNLHALCTFGTSLSYRQKATLFKLGTREIIFAWDSDATDKAYKEARRMTGLFNSVKVIQFPPGHDPDTYPVKKTLKLLETARAC